MLTTDEIRIRAVALKKTRGVYFLFYESEIVYIGQSTHIEYRLISHMSSDKVFDSYTAIECGDIGQDELNDLEADYIVEYDPVYNNGLPPNSKWATLNMLRSRIPLHTNLIKRFIKQQRIKDKNGYYRWSDFDDMPRG